MVSQPFQDQCSAAQAAEGTLNVRILFDAQHLYYLPHYLPVMQELQARGAECIVLSRDRSDPAGKACRKYLDGRFSFEAVADVAAAIGVANRLQPQWIIVGNDNPYWEQVDARTALLYHGNGVKSVYYSRNLMNVDVRFVEGPYRAREIAALYPEVRIESVGFPKLDPLLNGTAPKIDLAARGLDPALPALLYAPTFFPSSIECLPPDWPARLSGINMLIKPHQFSMTKPAYREQQQLFAQWRDYPNVWLADKDELSLVPFMATADLLVSEASSALFEFAALDRPVIWCDFLKLRWSYRGPLRYRLRRRMDQKIFAYADIGAHASSPAELDRKVHDELATPGRYADVRQRITADLIGLADGKASARVADILLAD